MEKGAFYYNYDHLDDEWVVEFDGHEVARYDGRSIMQLAEELNIPEAEMLRRVFALSLLAMMENEENGFFVSAVLTKLFNNGMNWTKEVR